MKLITVFISKTKQIYTKILTVSENRFHFLTLLELYVSSYLQTDFCTKTRLYNIFKTTNAKSLVKTNLESPFKALERHEKVLLYF